MCQEAWGRGGGGRERHLPKGSQVCAGVLCVCFRTMNRLLTGFGMGGFGCVRRGKGVTGEPGGGVV